MSAPSISYTSSYSDSGRSGTSTPSSEFVLSKLYLLSPHFIDGARLEAFTSKLEKGYGDKILLSVAHEESFDSKDVQAAVVRLGEAIPDACLANKQWTKVPEGKACDTTPRQSNPTFVYSQVARFTSSTVRLYRSGKCRPWTSSSSRMIRMSFW